MGSTCVSSLSDECTEWMGWYRTCDHSSQRLCQSDTNALEARLAQELFLNTYGHASEILLLSVVLMAEY